MAPVRNERDPQKPDPTEKVPRPPNAWILYRTARLKEMKAASKDGECSVKQADFSRIIGEMWKNEKDSVKKEFEKAAEIAKQKHAKKYPGYKYKPKSREEKLRARQEAKAAKKRAQQEAKAAKAAGRKGSAGPSGSSTSPAEASSSSVKLEDMEPVCRGSGPSPPLDSDDDWSLSSSTPSLPSDGDVYYQPPSFVNNNSTPLNLVAPGPSYPMRFFSNGFLANGDYMPSAVSTNASLPASTPSDSPPSYTEGDVAQFASQMGMATPHLVNHQQDMSLNGTPGLAELAAWVASTLTAAPSMDVGGIPDVVPRCPPGEVEMDVLAPPPPIRGQPSPEELLNEHDHLAPALDISEFYGTLSDVGHSQSIISPDAAAVLDAAQPLSLEELLAFGMNHPEIAAHEMDPSISFGYYSAEAAHTYPDRLISPQFEPPYAIDPAPLPPYSATEYGAFPTQADEQPAQSMSWVDPELLSLFNSHLMAPLPDSATSSSFQSFMSEPSSFESPIESQPHTPSVVPSGQFSEAVDPQQLTRPATSRAFPYAEFMPVDSAETEAPQSAPSHSRYVPPAGARLPPRRRVAARYPPRLPTADESA
ncbi:hypothetical protein PYCCODRAFT_1468729 [Trametes coccinea BRFM310]|uniref:HMG box domain-containing protein n=1 Tax=Trametes coccinea (strain BRFM310) TaxID=1353009 RepID=A0A1Y2IKZ6_TRAC3|nr:hypothetical protein PYCCODRAFT_1468729 [Trametes coccinea BRFM310]